MKIVAVCGSPRGAQSQTLRLAKALAGGATAAGATVELVDATRLKVEYCSACEACHRTGTCILHDDFTGLRKTMMEAEGIVFASPNYFRQITAPLKTVIDRMSDVIHCQLFTGKYACSVATAGGPAHDEVTAYLNQVLLGFGAWVVGGVGASMSGGPGAMAEAETRAAALGSELCEAIRSRRVYPEQAKQHEQTGAYFRRLVEFNKARWPHEHGLWTQKAQEQEN